MLFLPMKTVNATFAESLYARYTITGTQHWSRQNCTARLSELIDAIESAGGHGCTSNFVPGTG